MSLCFELHVADGCIYKLHTTCNIQFLSQRCSDCVMIKQVMELHGSFLLFIVPPCETLRFVAHTHIFK
jgi:hypothetical protein